MEFSDLYSPKQNPTITVTDEAVKAAWQLLNTMPEDVSVGMTRRMLNRLLEAAASHMWVNNEH